MKITYTPNPLNTIIELDEHEQRELWHKIRFGEMLDMLFSVHYEIAYKKEGPDMDRIKNEVDPEYYLNEKDGGKTPLDKRCDELLEHYLAELKSNHVGDCTCFAMSCSKCHAEDMLGVNTIKGLGKHPGHKIESVFSRWNPETKQHDRPEVSLDEALEKLRAYKPEANWPGWESYADRWAAEAKHAYEWLLAYRNEHFGTGDDGNTRH